MSLFEPNRHRGKLIVVEGIDGSGKSTQISLLSHWLRSQGYAVAFSEWNSSPLVRQTTRRGKRKEMFTPTTFSLIHATDFSDRMESYLLPLLKAGAIVCADRYAYTAFARDVARGVSRSEEHTSELQSQSNLVCRLLLEKKKKQHKIMQRYDPNRDDTHTDNERDALSRL